MKLLRWVLTLASFMLAVVQAFGVTSSFAPSVSYSSGVDGANSIVAVDVNGDGFPDMVVATNNGVSVLLNNGDGTFASPVTYSTGGPLSNSVAVADVNNDGNPDIVVTNMCTTEPPSCYGVGVLLGNGDGTFQPVVGFDSGGLETGAVAVGDVNGDGLPDLVLTSNCQPQTCAGGDLTVLLNTTSTTLSFAEAVQLSDTTGPVALGDMNGDQILDLVTASGVMLGNGDGTFQPAMPGIQAGANSITLSDVNGDGKLDVIATNATQVAVQLGNGDGTLQPAANFSTGGKNPLSVAVADFNGDGKPDLAVANECDNFVDGQCTTVATVGVLPGNGNGTFGAAKTYRTSGILATSVSAADVNQDGKTDFVVSNACVAAANCQNGIESVFINTYSVETRTAIASSLNPAVLSQTVTFTATITTIPVGAAGVPDGSPVTFTDGATFLGTSNTVNGVAMLTTSFSTTGKQTITASYGGDVYHIGSSRSLTETVLAYPSTTMVTSNPNPSTLHQSVTLTATVTSAEAGGPTGTVHFYDGIYSLGTATLSGGVAQLNTTRLAAGTQTINADYEGDTQSAKSTGSTTQTVNP